MLDMEARGRLFTAICEYAFDGDVATEMTGAERIVWPLVRSQIDRSVDVVTDKRSKTSAQNGSKGGRPAGGEKPNRKPNQKPNGNLIPESEKPKSERDENLTVDDEEPAGNLKNLTRATEVNSSEVNSGEVNSGEVNNARARATATATDDLVAYAANEITVMTPTAVQELETYCADLGEDLTRHAIEEALSNGVRSWAYVRSILQRYQRSGYRTVAEVKAAKDSRTGGGQAQNPALDYTQREYSADFYDGLYEDLSGIADEEESGK